MIPTFMRLNLVPGYISQKLKRVDWLGNDIFIVATTSFLIPLTRGGVQCPWGSWHTLVPLLIGVVGLVSFTLCGKLYCRRAHNTSQPAHKLQYGILTVRNSDQFFNCVRGSLFPSAIL